MSTVLAAFVAGLILGPGGSGTAHIHDHDHHFVEGLDSAEEVWTCSMHPQIRQPGPGSCPICGMDLIPVSTVGNHADHDAELPRLSVSERAAALMQVQTWPAERMALERETRLFGTVDYDETRVHDLVVLSEGVIEHLYVNYMNAPVRRGQPIAEFYSPQVLAAAEQLLIARDATRSGSDLLSAARRKLELLGVASGQVDRILERGEAPRTYTMYSPISGVMREMGGHVGHWLSAGEHLAEIVDYSNVWVWLEAYESDIPWIREGQPARFTTASFPGEQFEGRVDFIDPILMEGRRTARVRVDVANPGGSLKPGMFVQAQLYGSVQGSGTLVIPASAPLLTGKRAVVYVQVPGHDMPTFEGRDVALGPKIGDYYAVLDGIAEGELVVTHGGFRIDSELQIRGRRSMMAPEGGAPPAHDHGPAIPMPED